ncbi:MAG: hypothetical protein K5705_03745 [Oscillospiraceae bacterium]|nr:hypothetical protein [Oscillospiraceae bacterium]
MSIIFETKAKLYEDDMFVVNWLNEHNIKGSLTKRKGAITVFYLRKTGMTTHFRCEIHYKKVNLLKYLEHLDKALTERVEQEENAKQAALLVRRIKHLLGLDDLLIFLFINYIDKLEYCIDITVTDEILKLRHEYYRLLPHNRAKNYIDGNFRLYAQWGNPGGESNEFDYWGNFMYDTYWRIDTVDYIPVYNEI